MSGRSHGNSDGSGANTNSLVTGRRPFEAEESMAEFVSLVARDDWEGVKGIRGLAFSEDGEVVVNPMRPLIPDLDDLPQPA